MCIILIAFLSVACQKETVKDDTPPRQQIGPAYISDGKGGYKRIPADRVACQLMRTRIKKSNTQCTERVANLLGLSVVQCKSYLLQIADVCENNAMSTWDGEYTFKSCMSSIDQTTMCTIVLARGCKYTSTFADEVDGINLAKERDRFNEIKERRCEGSNPLLTLQHANQGNLETMLKD